MIKYETLLHPDKKLKKICEPVLEITDEIKNISTKMLETMYDASGIGLAAPQIGVLKRFFVMDCSKNETSPEPLVFINPEIVWLSEEKNTHEEGCLSIPEIYGEIERPARVKIRSMDLHGSENEYELDGIMATCAQHEIDHLNGVLFVDYLGPIRRQVVLSKMKKFKREKARSKKSIT